MLINVEGVDREKESMMAYIVKGGVWPLSPDFPVMIRLK